MEISYGSPRVYVYTNKVNLELSGSISELDDRRLNAILLWRPGERGHSDPQSGHLLFRSALSQMRARAINGIHHEAHFRSHVQGDCGVKRRAEGRRDREDVDTHANKTMDRQYTRACVSARMRTAK